MAITEQDRHRMYQRLEEVLGHEEASTLMEHLPPLGWADVATKRDVEHLAEVMNLRFAAVDAHVTQLEDRIAVRVERGLRQQTLALMGTYAALTGVLVAALKL
jgi:hypothetical protein